MPDMENDNQEHWMKAYWRPAIAFQYVAVCLFDFIIHPILNGIFYYYDKAKYVQWEPLTLKESGFYHLAMGAILGVAAWTRGMEKIRRSDDETEITKIKVSQTPKDDK